MSFCFCQVYDTGSQYVYILHVYVVYVVTDIHTRTQWPANKKDTRLLQKDLRVLDLSEYASGHWRKSQKYPLPSANIRSSLKFNSKMMCKLFPPRPPSRCDGRRDCFLDAKLEEFIEDPCPKTEKYLESHYICHSSSLNLSPGLSLTHVTWEMNSIYIFH